MSWTWQLLQGDDQEAARQQDPLAYCSCLERTVLRAFPNYSSVEEEEEEKEEAEERDVNLIRL